MEMRAFTAHRNKPPKRPARFSDSLPQEDKILLAPDLKLTIPGTNGLGAELKLAVSQAPDSEKALVLETAQCLENLLQFVSDKKMTSQTIKLAT